MELVAKWVLREGVQWPPNNDDAEKKELEAQAVRIALAAKPDCEITEEDLFGDSDSEE
jgi:hypothetical protein